MANDAIDGIRQHFQKRGKEAYKAGHARNSHGMMRGTAALFDFLIGYDQAKANSTPANGGRVELAQGEA